jgi:hypothetical protein
MGPGKQRARRDREMIRPDVRSVSQARSHARPTTTLTPRQAARVKAAAFISCIARGQSRQS